VPFARRVLRLTVPALVLGGSIVAARTAAMREPWRDVLSTALVASLLAAGVLGITFGRNRVFLAALGLAVAALLTGPPFASAATPAGLLLREATLAWLCLSFAVLALLPERGLLTLNGGLRIFALLVPFAFAFWLEIPETAATGQAIDHLIRAASPRGVEPGVGVAGLSVALLLACALLREAPLDAALAGATTALGLMLSGTPGAEQVRVYGTAGGLVLLLGLVHESHRLAFRDELTGLPARRALNESLAVLDGPYALAMVDVDHFKKFNDTHGHDVGDQVLRLVASELGRVGGGGRAFRYGGEEFTVLFAGRTARQALPHLEALRTAIRAARLTLRAKDRPAHRPKTPRHRKGTKHVSVTVSIGLAERDNRNPTPAQVLKAADQALYRAKASGRNRVVGAADSASAQTTATRRRVTRARKS